MPSTPTHFPSGRDWVHRGTVRPVTLGQARLALAVCLLQTPECVARSTEGPVRARLALDSGRSALVLIELRRLPQGIGVSTTVENVHEEDIPEVTRIHERLTAAYPVMAAAVLAAGVQEVV
jgi:hypothetical protein